MRTSARPTPTTKRWSRSSNIFHHRMLSLFYRAWAVNQKAADLDRPDVHDFARYIGSFFGLGMADAAQPRRRARLGEALLLRLAGRPDAQRRRTRSHPARFLPDAGADPHLSSATGCSCPRTASAGSAKHPRPAASACSDDRWFARLGLSVEISRPHRSRDLSPNFSACCRAAIPFAG